MNKTFALFCLAAVTLLSTPAFADSKDEAYRRGYEQGWRDAMEAARHGGGNERRAAIIIEEAGYGVRGRMCDARGRIQSMAGGRRSVDVMVDNDLCGDPAEGQFKRLWVRYRCGDGQPVRAEAREKEVISLQCR